MLFEVVFWLSFLTLVYAYFGFFGVLLLVSIFRKTPVHKKDILPSVSLILCAFNEGKHIRKKIDNCKALDYPQDRLEIIVVSDASTDETDTLLKQMNDPQIRVHRLEQRCGKTGCQNEAAKMARNEVLFFTDATTMHPPDALRLLVRALHDPTVGCVTGKPVFNRDEGLTSKGLNKRESYELFLRKKLGQVISLFGAQDCVYVVPAGLYIPVRSDLDSGFVGPLKILECGYRTVYEPEALAFVDRPVPKIKDEFIRRSRIVLRGMRGLIHMRKLMNPFRHGFLAVSLVSSRLLRWLTPVFLLLLFGSNLFLLGSSFYLGLFLLQILFYLMALAAFLLEITGRRVGFVFYIPLYFCILACSAAVGLKRLLAGETGQLWQTRR